MGPSRIAIAAGGLGGSAGLVFAIYQVQGWTMPDSLAGILAGLIVIAGIAFLGILAWDGCQLVAGALRGKTLRWPVIDRNAPNPNQWLLDIAEHDAANPESCIVAVRQVLRNWNVGPDTPHPFIEVGVTFRNVGVHDILIGPIKGFGNYAGQELAEAIEVDGKTKLPRRSEYEMRLKQYVPREMAAAIYDERVNAKRITLGLGNVAVTLEADCPGAQPKKWYIQLPDGFFRAED